MTAVIQDDSKLLSGFPFIGHGNADSNLESLFMSQRANEYNADISALGRSTYSEHKLPY
jgi:hypothetical protein